MEAHVFMPDNKYVEFVKYAEVSVQNICKFFTINAESDSSQVHIVVTFLCEFFLQCYL